MRIMTPDKDLAQCLRGDRVVQVDRRQRKVTDEATFRATRGFGPASVPDFLALTGDTADGIPGLPGFGEKGASLLIGAYAHIEAIPDQPLRWTVKPRGALQLAATLAAQREEALFYRRLATLIDTVPLAESLEELRFRGVPRGRFEAWCDAVGQIRSGRSRGAGPTSDVGWPGRGYLVGADYLSTGAVATCRRGPSREPGWASAKPRRHRG